MNVVSKYNETGSNVELIKEKGWLSKDLWGKEELLFPSSKMICHLQLAPQDGRLVVNVCDQQ